MKWSILVGCILLVKVQGECNLKEKSIEKDLEKSIDAKTDLHVEETARFGKLALEESSQLDEKAHQVDDKHVRDDVSHAIGKAKETAEEWEHHSDEILAEKVHDEKVKNVKSQSATKAHKDEYIDDDEEVAYKTIKESEHVAKEKAHAIKHDMGEDVYKYLKSEDGKSHAGEEVFVDKMHKKVDGIIIDEAHVKALEDSIKEKKLKVHEEIEKEAKEAKLHEILKEMYGEEALLLEKDEKAHHLDKEAVFFYEKEGKLHKIPVEILGESFLEEFKKKHVHGGAFFLDKEGKITDITKELAEALLYEKEKSGYELEKGIYKEEGFLKEKGHLGKGFQEEAFYKGLGKAFHEEELLKKKEITEKMLHEKEGIDKKKAFASGEVYHSDEALLKAKEHAGKAFHEEAFLKGKGLIGKEFHEDEAFLKGKDLAGKSFHEEEAFLKEMGLAGKAFHEETLLKEKGLAGKKHDEEAFLKVLPDKIHHGEESFFFEKDAKSKAHFTPKVLYGEESLFKTKDIADKIHIAKGMYDEEGFLLKEAVDAKTKGMHDVAHRDSKKLLEEGKHKIAAEDHFIGGTFFKGMDEAKVHHGFKEFPIVHDKEEKFHLGKAPHEGEVIHGRGSLLMRFLSAVKAHQAQTCHLVSMGRYELLSVINCISKSKDPVLCGKFVTCEMKMPEQVIVALEKCKRETLGDEVKRCSRYEDLYPSLKIPAKIIKCVDKSVHKLSSEEKKKMIDFEECARTLKKENCGKHKFAFH